MPTNTPSALPKEVIMSENIEGGEIDWNSDEAAVRAVFPECYANQRGGIVVFENGQLRGGAKDWKTAREFFPEALRDYEAVKQDTKEQRCQ